jgi:hypothetical protein
MKHVFRSALLLWAIGWMTPLASADGGIKASTPEQRAILQTRFMKQHLRLSDADSAKVQAINLNYARQMEPVLKSDGSGIAKTVQARRIMADKDAELRSVLSQEQFAAYDEAKDNLKAWLESQLR